MRRAGPTAVALLTVAGSLSLAACGGTGKAASTAARASSGTASTAAGTASDTIVIKDFTFQPAELTVRVGATVTVHNDDSAAHTLTADDGSFDTGTIGGGGTATITVKKAGRFTYHCAIHQSMRGTLTVSG